jgi:hypothetical protein
MSMLRNAILPITLGLFLAPVAWAGDDDKKPEGGKGQEQKVWGVVSEVTVLGETDIDFKTRKAITAEATYVTILGHPAHHEWMHKEGATASSENRDRDRDRDVRRTSSDSSARSGERSRHRMNVYVLAVSPTTKVCEVSMGKEGSASAKEEASEIDKLEIGDRVEISFEPRMSSDEKDNGKVEVQKHGRHRTYFGTATAIKIIDEPVRFDSSAPSGQKTEKSEKK